MTFRVSAVCLAILLALTVSAQQKPSSASFSVADVDGIYPKLETLYVDLHRNPELSLHEQKTAAKLADALRALGFEVTTGVGGTGVVGVLRNGTGPTVMIRTELDALPVEEKTGLPYASHETTKDDSGATVPVMHACGHDVHMTSWTGTATLLSTRKDKWRGTVVMLAQPAEERGLGAVNMMRDGLLTRFPRPDYILAIHDDSNLPSGTVGYIVGPAQAQVDSVDLTIFGRGGHGALPQTTVDPVVIAARTILALQTLVSRENNPLDPAVVTVGSIHGGTKHNIIPDSVHMQITVRSYSDEVQKHLISGIERIARAEAMAANAPRQPEMKISDPSHVMVNDPKLTDRLIPVLKRAAGDKNIVQMQPKMVSEDFAEYGLAGIPATMFYVGAVEPEKFAAAKASGTPLPSLHSGNFAPDTKRTIETGIITETAAALELLGKP